MEFVIILGLILLNGLFSMSEIAVISARKTSLKQEAQRGSKAALSALKLSDNPDNFLSTIQVGITLIGIVTGLYSGDVLAGHVAPWVVSLGVPAAYAYPITKVVLVILVTYLTIVFGELVPKRIGMSSAEKVAKIMAAPMHILSIVMRPFVWILSKSTGLVISLLGVKPNDAKVTEEEIKSMIREGTEDGEVKEVEQDIVERVFSLGDRDLESIMTHRMDVVALDAKMSKEEIKKLIVEHPFSKYPVMEDDLDHIVGVVYVKDIFAHTQTDRNQFDLNKVLRTPQFFYENTEVYTALEQMKQTHNHFAFILDEFGTFRGVVTLKDIMEAIVGEIPEKNEEPDIVQRADGSYLIDGQWSFYDFMRYFKLHIDSGDYEFNTLGGLLLEELGHIPKVGEQVSWQRFVFEVVDMDGARIDKILATEGIK